MPTTETKNIQQYKYATVSISLPVDREFDYATPQRLRTVIAIGKRVWVPFREKDMVGVVVGLSDTSDIPDGIC